MGFCEPQDYLQFMRQTPELERMLVNSGIHLFKFWFSVSREEQLRRFISRRDDPLKHWKLSPIDIQSLDRWDDYTDAKNHMFSAHIRVTHLGQLLNQMTKNAPELYSSFSYLNWTIRIEPKTQKVDEQIVLIQIRSLKNIF